MSAKGAVSGQPGKAAGGEKTARQTPKAAVAQAPESEILREMEAGLGESPTVAAIEEVEEAAPKPLDAEELGAAEPETGGMVEPSAHEKTIQEQPQEQPQEEVMSATETKAAKAAGEKVDILDTLTQYYTKSIERLADLQKKGIETLAQQNAELVGSWKKQAPAVPGVELLDLASKAFDRYVETQKSNIDLLVEQSHKLADLAKERASEANKTVESGVKIAEEVIEHAVAANKTAIDFTAKQTKAAIENVKLQFVAVGIPAGPAAESIERGVEIVAGAQKDILDAIKKPVYSSN